MTHREALAYIAELLSPPPPCFGHETTHDELCRWADDGHDGEG